MSKTIALIIPSVKNSFSTQIACVVNTEVEKYGYITLIGDGNGQMWDEKVELQHSTSRNLNK